MCTVGVLFTTVSGIRRGFQPGTEVPDHVAGIHAMLHHAYRCWWAPLRGTILNRTYGEHKNLYVSLFVPTMFGPIYYGPPRYILYVYSCSGVSFLPREELTIRYRL